MKIRGLVAVTALALSLLSASSSEARNQPADIFSSKSISQITITISDKSAGKIARAPKVSVPARFAISNDSGSLKYNNLPVDFHLKGTSTLRQNPSLVSSRPSLRVKFHQNGAIKLPFLGSMSSLTLNSMTQDPSKVHEYTAYKLYNAMGVPAPRVGYAKVTVVIGGRSYDKGLFAIIEPYDDAFLEKRFQTRTQHLYEPCGHWTDVTRPGTSKGIDTCDNAVFEVKEGWKSVPNKLDLRALSSIQKLTDNAEWWTAMDRYTDRDEFIRMWAVENFISAWDSYSGAIINNYYLRSDSMGVFTMMPTGADETFAYNFKMDATSIGYPLIYDNFQIQTKGRGIMFTRCLNYKPCRNQYLDTLKTVKAKAASIKLKDSVDKISAVLNREPNWAQLAVKNWIDMKSNDVDALLSKYGR
jgi:spore coat protein CotH